MALSEKEEGWTKKSGLLKKKMLAMDRDVKRREAGEVNDCKQIRKSECENVFVLAHQAGWSLWLPEEKNTMNLGTCFLFCSNMQINKDANRVLINDQEDA